MFYIPVEQLLTSALIFIRIGGILFALPIFGDQPTPVRVRILLAFALTYGISPLVQSGWLTQLPTDPIAFGVVVIKELLIGLMVGYVAKMAFDGLLMAAAVVGYQMGFGTASLFIPDAGFQMDGFTAFHRLVVMLIFLSLNLHHLFIKGIVESFHMIPAGMATPDPELGMFFIKLSAGIFYVAIQLAAPILVALMFTTAAMGLVARTVPQMNVFTMSFPINFFIGLLVYIATLPFFPQWMRGHFEGNYNDFYLTLLGLVP